MAVQEKSLDLKRAQHAMDELDALKGRSIGHYVSYVKAMPANILQNGLGQTVAMLLSAAKGDSNDPHRQLHDQVARWLCREDAEAPYAGKSPLIEAITQGSEQDYLAAHAETLAYLVWLKKLAVAFLKEPE